MRRPSASPPVALSLLLGLGLGALALAAPARAELPTGYLVWSKGTSKDPASRKIYRLTLPGKTDLKALTSGEDVECQVSPDGAWVAYAKAKLTGGSDYHAFHLWKVYLVSIHGAQQGRTEIKIDDSGYWPSWGGKDVLYYNQVESDGNGKHSRIIRVTLDAHGKVLSKSTFFSTQSAFPDLDEIGECFVAPDGSWFSARTRGTPTVNGVGAYLVQPPTWNLLARAGSIGCMGIVAPGGGWGLIAGAEQGIRWGDAPSVAGRKEDQLLIAAHSAEDKVYHPGIASDERWVLAAHGLDQDHNAGPYDVYIHSLDAKTRTAGPEQALATGGFNGWPTVWVGTPTPPPPPRPWVQEFYPSSYTVAPGEEVTLTWTTQEAESAELDGAAVALAGTQAVKPQQTTTYKLVAKSTQSSETGSAEVVVTVNATPQPVTIESFTASAESIEQGQSVTLSWRVKNATTLDLDGGRAAPVASLEVSPLQTTSYLLTARGQGGPVVQTVTVNVRALGNGLLPDRGGFLCALPGDGAALLPAALLLLGWCGARVRRAHRRDHGQDR